MPKCVLAISLSILLLPSLVFAQASSATLSGTIKDTSGGVMIEVIPGDDNMKLIIPLRKSGKPGEE